MPKTTFTLRSIYNVKVEDAAELASRQVDKNEYGDLGSWYPCEIGRRRVIDVEYSPGVWRRFEVCLAIHYNYAATEIIQKT